MEPLPIACNLAPADFERRKAVLQDVVARVQEASPLPNGYAFHFNSEPGTLSELVELIEFERACCPFLDFSLHLEANNGSIRLEASGPEGTAAFLEEIFGLKAA